MVIAFANLKGGVGKTTLAFLLSSLNHLLKTDYTILSIDLDPQANLTSRLLRDLKKAQDGNISRFFQGTISLDELIFPSRFTNNFIVPSHLELEITKEKLKQKINGVFALKKGLKNITMYDIVVLDCPPSLDILTANALVAADVVFIPVSPDDFSLSGLLKIKEVIDAAKDLNPELRVGGIIPNLIDKRYRVHNEFLKNLQSQAFAPILPPIPRRAAIQKALKRRIPLTEVPGASETLREMSLFVQKILGII